MSGRQTAEAFPNVVTDILVVQSYDVYAVIDPGSTLSYATPFVAMEFGKEPEQLHEPFSVSTPVSESILATRVYRSYVVTVCGSDTRADLIELGMVDFDGDNVVPRGRFISYLKAAKMINKGCIYHLDWVTEANVEALSLESVSVVNEFPDELPGIPPDREIGFGINMMLGTQPISIPP
ncbi:uncharacterized protein [Nicotiana sylvestris]|uniref:uncharacterized protein n=1 Tax=Nicotiana sylvestris TaxID=4096 RepID=UPI00388C8899